MSAPTFGNIVNAATTASNLQKSASPPPPGPSQPTNQPPPPKLTPVTPLAPFYAKDKKGRIEIAFTKGNTAGENVEVTFNGQQAVLTNSGNAKIDLTNPANSAQLDLLRKVYNDAPDSATNNASAASTTVSVGGNGRKKRSLTHKRRQQQKKRVRKSMRH
jgi:hypothetical protein